MYALLLALTSTPDMPAPVEIVRPSEGACPQVDMKPGQVASSLVVDDHGVWTCEGVTVPISLIRNSLLHQEANEELRSLLAISYDEQARLEIERDWYRDNQRTGLVERPGAWALAGAVGAALAIIGYEWASSGGTLK